jgi:hypothetical protein
VAGKVCDVDHRRWSGFSHWRPIHNEARLSWRPLMGALRARLRRQRAPLPLRAPSRSPKGNAETKRPPGVRTPGGGVAITYGWLGLSDEW